VQPHYSRVEGIKKAVPIKDGTAFHYENLSFKQFSLTQFSYASLYLATLA